MPPSIPRLNSILAGAVFFASVVLLSACQSSADLKSTQEQADRFRNEGKLKEAIKSYTVLIKEMDQNQGDQAKELLVMNKLSKCLLKDHQISKADSYAQRALAIAERLYGPDHANIIPQLVLLKEICEAIPDKERHQKYLTRMIDVQAKTTGEDSPPVMWLLDSYARTYSASCGAMLEPDRLRLLVRLRDKFVGPNDTETIRDRMMLADCLARSGPSAESLEIYESCLQTARAHCKALLPELLLRYAKVLKIQKQNARAVPVLKEAFKLSGPGANYNPVYATETAVELGDSLQDIKQNKEAVVVYSSMLAPLKKSGDKVHVEYFESQIKACK